MIRNEARSQAVEYEASMVDVPGTGKTSQCLGDGELWQNTVWGKEDFVSQEKFDFKLCCKWDGDHIDNVRSLHSVYCSMDFTAC